MRRSVSPADGAAVCLVLMLAGCSSDGGDDRSSDGREPMTSRAIAAVAVDHFQQATSAREKRSAGNLGKGAVGAVLQFHGKEENRGEKLEVIVGTKLGPFYQRCLKSDRVICRLGVSELGYPYRLVWQRALRGHSGFVSVLLDRGDQELFVIWSGGPGQRVTGDPRKLDLPVGVDELIELLDDPRLGLTTTPATIDEGQELGVWR